MDILGKARKLESTLARTFDRAAQQWSKSGPRGPLEILHAILEAVEERLEPAGRGNARLSVQQDQACRSLPPREMLARVFRGVLDEAPPLQERISDRLRELGCDVPDSARQDCLRRAARAPVGRHPSSTSTSVAHRCGSASRPTSRLRASSS